MKLLLKGVAWVALMAISTAALVASSAEWPMRRHDPSGCSATEMRVRPPLRLAWRTRLSPRKRLLRICTACWSPGRGWSPSPPRGNTAGPRFRG